MTTGSVQGSGTQTDPYTVSSKEDFDLLMGTSGGVPNFIPNFSCVHLGPGTFLTAGYYDGSTGWQARPGMRIVSSGIDVTKLQLVSSTANKNIYAVAHALSLGTPVDFFKISDMTTTSTR